MPTKKSPIIVVDGSLKSESYVNYAGAGGQAKFTKAINSATEAYSGIARGAMIDTTFKNVRPGISSRPEFSRLDYNYFRPGEASPVRYREVVMACDNLYKNFELVRNIIDLMSDFACQGIRFVHPVKNHERFYNAWFQQVCGFDRSERFLNYLYRHAMVVAEARTGFMNIQVEREFYSQAGEIEIQKDQIKSKNIPLQYIFHHPALVEPKNNINSDKVLYELAVTNKNQEYTNSPNTLGFTGQKRDLPPDSTFVCYYKRDDWSVKPTPFLFPLIEHAVMINKLALADSAALDGAISSVRIFKLGNLEYKIAPTDAAVSRLDEILQSNVGGGSLDIIWGPDIELLESKTDVHHFLGEEKYVPHFQRLYVGLGIPPTLSGHGGGGTTNNYVSLKVLMKRLQYGRKLLLDFWDKQVKWVQKAMGFARPAKIEFDFLDLGDEATEKALLVQLADRNLISDEKLQTIFGFDADQEKARLNRENRERRSGRRVSKISSLPDSIQVALKKIALQKGFLNPEQLGVEIEKDTEKQKTPFDKQLDVQKMKGAQPGISNKGRKPRGRPGGSKDSSKRKPKAFKPKIKAALDIWSTDAQTKIHNLIKPEFLKIVGKANMRQLTAKEADSYEKITFNILFNVTPFNEITKELVVVGLEQSESDIDYKSFINYINGVKLEVNRELTLDETRKIQLFLYNSKFEDELNGDS